MSNSIQAYLNLDDEFEIRTVTPEGEGSYEVLKVNGDLTIFTSREQVEQLFNTLDKHLHTDTYTQLEDYCLNLESDLEKANELIDDLEDRMDENFYQAN